MWLGGESVKAYLNMILAGRKILRQYKDYLRAGHYYCKAGSKLIFYDSKIPAKSGSSLLLNDKSFANPNPILEWVTKTLLHSTGTGTASMAMLTVNGDVKIFDYEKGIVITEYKDSLKAQKIKKCIERYSPYFMIPSISVEVPKNQIVEKIIQADRHVPDEKYYAFRKFAEQYIFYFNTLKSKDKSTTSWERLISTISGDLRKILFDISPEIEKDLVQIRIHGDGHFDNLIIGKDGIVYVIDWETERTDWFLYDLLNYCYVDYLNYKSFDMLDIYFAGKIDDLLIAAFQAIGLKYESCKKTDLLKVFFAFRAKFDQTTGHEIKGWQEIMARYNLDTI